jgi:predicted MFS family arabinose efflux permease
LLADPIHDREILSTSIGNLAFGVTYLAAITTFLPVYLGLLGCTPAVIGVLFLLRGIVTTAGRVPVSWVLERVSTHKVMLASVLAEAAVLALMGLVRPVPALACLLAVEGLAYGAYLTSGQIHLLAAASVDRRGTAMSFYSLAGVLGGSIGAAALGLIADRVGPAAALLSAGALALVAVVLMARMWSVRHTSARGSGRPSLR